MDNHIFRSALSGFNRQDVMEYIERSQKQAEETAAQLEAQAQQLRQESGEARQALEECTAERDTLSRQLEDMTLRYHHAKNNWEAQTQAKDSFRQDVAQRDQAVRELTEENQRLFRRVQELEAQMEAARLEKERVAQLELDAHRRADDILAQAQACAAAAAADADAQAKAAVEDARQRAAALIADAQERAHAHLRDAEEKVGETAAEYDRLFQIFTSATDGIAGELRKLDAAAAQLPPSFDRLRSGLAQLQDDVRARTENRLREETD